jgi:ribosomal protein S18 acetylase RimI-like enzyme
VSPVPRFVPASGLPLERLAALFNRGYEGYLVPVQLDAATFEGLTAAWDIRPEHARVAFEDGEPVAFALLGVRESRGWIGGMGVVPEWRGKALGRAAMEAVLAEARALGLHEVGLEVIHANTWASRIYEGLGFRDTRVLDVWTRAADAPAAPLPPGAPAVARILVADALAAHASLHPERPPWQRDWPSLHHQAARLAAWGVRGDDGPAAVAIAQPSPRGLALMALAERPGAPAGATAALVSAMVAAHPGIGMGFTNLPEGDPAGAALTAAGFTVRLQQREMSLRL